MGRIEIRKDDVKNTESIKAIIDGVEKRFLQTDQMIEKKQSCYCGSDKVKRKEQKHIKVRGSSMISQCKKKEEDIKYQKLLIVLMTPQQTYQIVSHPI